MNRSKIALDRILERSLADNPDQREQFDRTGRPLVSDGRSLSDEELLQQLTSLGFDLEREDLERRLAMVPSAQMLAEILIIYHQYLVPNNKEDWVWIAVLCLWERWFPDRPNFEMVDDFMQGGYDCLEQQDSQGALKSWHATWQCMEQLMSNFEIATFEQYDTRFGGTHSAFDWVQDYLRELQSAGSTDRSCLHQQRDLFRSVLEFATGSARDEALIPAFETALIACLEELGDGESAERPLAEKLDRIISQLDRRYNGVLPERAIRLAQEYREEITPRLIDMLVEATEVVRCGESRKGSGPLIATYLLVEFEAQEALPALLEVVSLPGEGAFELLGDALTERLGRFLTTLTDDPTVIDHLLQDSSLNEYVRWAASHAFLYWVRDGKMTREDAIERLRALLASAIKNRDLELVDQLLAELVSYAPHPILNEIDEAFSMGTVDETMVCREQFDLSKEEAEELFTKSILHLPAGKVVDTVQEMKKWASYDPPSLEKAKEAYADKPVYNPTPIESTNTNDLLTSDAPITIRNTEAKIGRNAPCPCGSQKKYKKCCLHR